MHKSSKERRQITIEKGVKIEMALKSAIKQPSQTARHRLQQKPYAGQELSDQTRARITEQRKRKEQTK